MNKIILIHFIIYLEKAIVDQPDKYSQTKLKQKYLAAVTMADKHVAICPVHIEGLEVEVS